MSLVRHPGRYGGRAAGILALAGTLGTGLPQNAQNGSHRPEWLTPCQVRQVDTPALCGVFEVWENRAMRTGTRIGLNVVVLPALGADRADDPVFFLHGGPGAAASDAAPWVSRLLARVHQRRDLVFVDVRGTGRSNPLTCLPPEAQAPLQEYFGDFVADDFVRRCLARQRSDVRMYTTPIAMDDIDEVRLALGYRRINLFGSSGGTRAEQLYMRQHGDAVRSVVMHGVVPMNAEVPLRFGKALEIGLSGMFDACTAERACREAYPDLQADWERSKTLFANGPVETVVEHPRTGRRESVRIGRGVYIDGVRHLLYTVESARRLPGLIQTASRGDFRAFAQFELEQALGFQRAIAMGTFLTTTCAEDLRFVSETDVQEATAGTSLGDYRVRRQLAACRLWPAGQGIDGSYQDPVGVDTPTLLISGAVDVATPAEDGERVARGLPNGRHVVFPNQGHEFANAACASRLIAEFIAAASAATLDVSCAAETARPAFDTGS